MDVFTLQDLLLVINSAGRKAYSSIERVLIISIAVGVWAGEKGIFSAQTLAKGTVPASFIFGDSLTDVGNNNYLQYALAKANFPWYGIDYEGGTATGRFTNGRTIGDIITEKLGLPSPQPYLALTDTDDALLQGANYASGGAGILNETGFLFIQKLSFNTQIDYFEATKLAIAKRLGAAAAEKLSNEALYFIGIGSNDYINNFLLPYATDAQKYSHDGFVDLLVSTLRQQLTRLHTIGARKIVFHGLAPLGCIPSQLSKSGQNGGCLRGINTWVSQFNDGAQKLIKELNSKLPAVKITYADTYAMFMELIQNPRAYGFNVSDAPCCNVDTTFGQLCLPNSSLCQQRRDYIFWDAFHPTDAANVVIADMLVADPDVLQYKPPKSLSPSPSPSPVQSPAPARSFRRSPSGAPAPHAKNRPR
eukprot:Gb_20603 [translate_table: standard]